jgi:hypothetical protein
MFAVITGDVCLAVSILSQASKTFRCLHQILRQDHQGNWRDGS